MRLKYHIRDACELDKSLMCWKQMGDMTHLLDDALLERVRKIRIGVCTQLEGIINKI